MSLDPPEQAPLVGNVPEPTSAASNGAPSADWLEEEEDFRDEYEDFLNDANIVSVPLPLDLYLEESRGGKVYVDELVAGGNAEKVGGVSVGDVVIAVSLPFGDGLVPVPTAGAIDMVQDHIKTRDEGEDFLMALVPGDVELLSQEDAEDGLDDLTLEEMDSNAKKIYVNEYPYSVSPDPFAEQQLDLEALKEQGFDI